MCLGQRGKSGDIGEQRDSAGMLGQRFAARQRPATILWEIGRQRGVHGALLGSGQSLRRVGSVLNNRCSHAMEHRLHRSWWYAEDSSALAACQAQQTSRMTGVLAVGFGAGLQPAKIFLRGRPRTSY